MQTSRERKTWTVLRPDGETEVDYDVQFNYTPNDPGRTGGDPEKAYPPEEGSVDILRISGPIVNGVYSRLPEIPEADWEKHGFDDAEIKRFKEKTMEDPPEEQPEPESDDRDETLTEAPESMPYRINNPGHPAHDLEYVIWYEMEPAATGDQPIDSSGSKPVIQYITRAGSPEKRLPEDHWERFGFTADELDAVLDTISNAEHQDFVRNGGRDEAHRNLAEGHVSHTLTRPATEYAISYATMPDGKLEITRVALDSKPDVEIPKADWRDLGITGATVKEIADRVADPNEELPPTGTTSYEVDEEETEFDVYYSTTSGATKATRDDPGSGAEVEIDRIELSSSGKEIPKADWYKFGLTPEVLDSIYDAAREDSEGGGDVSEPDWDSMPGGHDDYDESMDVEKWARLKAGMGDWPAGTEVTITHDRRNSDGSRDVGVKGPGGKSDQLSLDAGEKLDKYVEMLEMRKIGMSMNEMRGLAGLSSKQEGSNIKVTDADRAVQKDWRRMAVNPSKNLVETSETTGGAIVTANFVFPDLGSLLGYTQKKLPVTLMRSIDRMTSEGQNTMALMLNELQKLKPATDQLVEIFAGLVDGIDKFDAGSIEGREVARVFRFLADAARFTQGGAELTEQL